MKKLKGLFIILILMFMFSINYSYGYYYSNPDYSINIPSNYKNISNGHWLRQDSEVEILIQSVPIESTQHFKYNNQNLNSLVKSLNESANQYENVRIDILDKSVQKFTKNKYKGFFIKSIYSLSGYNLYAIQYVVGSNNVMYMLTIESTNLGQLNSYEVKDIVDSFTISNFNSIEDTSLSDRLIVATLSVIIIEAVYNFIANRKNKKHVDMNSYNIKQ